MSLKDVVKILNQMEDKGVINQYGIGGAIAATFYLEPIATIDVDVFVTLQAAPGSLLISLAPIFNWIIDHGGEMKGEYIVVAGWPVQFLPPVTPLVDEALREAVSTDVDGEVARVFSAEHLAAIALETSRPKDKTRLYNFIEADVIDTNRFKGIIDRYNLAEKWQNFRTQFLEDSPNEI